jgi:hypothetical protein
VSRRRPAWRAAVVLGILFLATAAAAVAAQRLKDDPALVRRVHVTPLFSPNGDGWRDRATVRLIPGQTDRLAVTVLDGQGHVVRHVARARHARRRRFVRFRWYGRTDGGRPAPAGTYRVRVVLHRRGHAVTLRDAIRLSRRAAHGGRAAR